MTAVVVALGAAWLSGFFTLAAIATEPEPRLDGPRHTYTSDGIRLIGTDPGVRINMRMIFFVAAAVWGLVAASFAVGVMHAL